MNAVPGNPTAIRDAEIRLLLQAIPFGERLVRGAGQGRVSGCALMLSIPRWLDELLGNALPESTVWNVQLVQAHLLVHLQFVDDALDGEFRMGQGDPAAPLATAEQRLARFFPPSDQFWDAYRGLWAEQRDSARWEAEGRGGSPPSWDGALLAAIGRKGALLRWPGCAMAALAGRPDMRDFLDEVCASLLRIALLFDDLSDVEEDSDRGRINAVLCAGAVATRDPPQFYPNACRGAEKVCATIRTELDALGQTAPEGTEFVAACEQLKEQCAAALETFKARCAARMAAHFFEILADRFGDAAGSQAEPDGSRSR